MPRYAPQSQTRELLDEKRLLVRRLLARGVSQKNICLQLRCSQVLVRQVKAELQAADEMRTETGEE